MDFVDVENIEQLLVKLIFGGFFSLCGEVHSFEVVERRSQSQSFPSFIKLQSDLIIRAINIRRLNLKTKLRLR